MEGRFTFQHYRGYGRAGELVLSSVDSGSGRREVKLGDYTVWAADLLRVYLGRTVGVGNR